MGLDLSGQRSVITGGARGMGFAIAARFLDAGASVTLWDIDPGTLESAKEALSPRGTVVTKIVDVADFAAVETGAKEAVEALGGIELLVNAAGVAGADFDLSGGRATY
ncbi:MAG: SDR family NAD(P)-dependent oxidoreductase [Paracoccaceae bacterium]